MNTPIRTLLATALVGMLTVVGGVAAVADTYPPPTDDDTAVIDDDVTAPPVDGDVDSDVGANNAVDGAPASEDLPATGTSVAVMVLVGAGVLAAGGLVLLGTRRRSRAQA